MKLGWICPEKESPFSTFHKCTYKFWEWTCPGIILVVLISGIRQKTWSRATADSLVISNRSETLWASFSSSVKGVQSWLIGVAHLNPRVLKGWKEAMHIPSFCKLWSPGQHETSVCELPPLAPCVLDKVLDCQDSKRFSQITDGPLNTVISLKNAYCPAIIPVHT